MATAVETSTIDQRLVGAIFEVKNALNQGGHYGLEDETVISQVTHQHSNQPDITWSLVALTDQEKQVDGLYIFKQQGDRLQGKPLSDTLEQLDATNLFQEGHLLADFVEPGAFQSHLDQLKSEQVLAKLNPAAAVA